MSDEVFPLEQVRLGRDVIEAVGADTERFLQGQLSQDVVALSAGASTYTLLLAPQGKVDALLRITRTAADRYLLDVDSGWGQAVMTRLGRFKLRTKCQLTLFEDWTCWSVRGGAGVALPAPEPAEIVADAGWPVLAGFDRLGPDLQPQPSMPIADAARYDDWRVVAGVPAMGAELDENTIPAEAGQWLIKHAVSFTKGCYTGQELVARIDSRGSNTPRRLRRLVVVDSSTIPVGTGMPNGTVAFQTVLAFQTVWYGGQRWVRAWVRSPPWPPNIARRWPIASGRSSRVMRSGWAAAPFVWRSCPAVENRRWVSAHGGPSASTIRQR